MSVPSILPPNRTRFLAAYEQALAYEPGTVPGIDTIPNIKGRQLPPFLQFLLYEYGLIELTPYVPDVYALLAEGRDWQLERDTFAAIARGLGWVEAPAEIREAAIRRRWWNAFHLYFEGLPPNDSPALGRIDRVTNLGKPFRSDFRRGVWGYDAPALEAGETRLACSMLAQDSGVRLRPGGPVWSFGRVHERVHTLTPEEGGKLGFYVIPEGEVSILALLVEGEYAIGGAAVDLDEIMSYARSGPQSAFNLAGELVDFEEDEPPITDRGLVLEPASANHIANNQDGSAWAFPASSDGLTISRVAYGTTNGMAYSDFRIHGTTTDRRGTFLAFNGAATAAAPGEAWTHSVWLARIGGSAAGLSHPDAPEGLDITTLPTSLTRLSLTWEADGEQSVEPGIMLNYEAGSAVDITIRIALPQVEPRAEGSGVIKTSGAPAARGASAITLLLPFGQHYISVTFDDDSTVGLGAFQDSHEVDVGALPRSIITKIEAVQMSDAVGMKWAEMGFPWDGADFPWVSEAAAAVRIIMAQFFEHREGFLALRDGEGALIGYRRFRTSRQVASEVDGPYSLGGVRYAPDAAGINVMIEAMTEGDGDGRRAASASLAFAGVKVPGVPPGRLWLEPGELSGAVEIAPLPIDVPLRRTVRERFKFLLRF